ncbi:MAG: glycosyltransferase [Chloroflexota bacterium]
MTRVCLLSAEYPPARGGVGDYTRELAAGLVRAGVEASILTSARLRVPAEDPPGVPVRAAVRDWGFGSWQAIADYLRSERPDVLHVQYQTAAYGMHPAIDLLPWRLRALGLSVPVVTTFHDLRFPYLFPKAGALRHLPALSLAWGSKAVVLVAREHWVETPLAWLRRLKPDLWQRTHVVPIGSNIPAEAPLGYDRAARRQSLGVGEDDFLLCFFGFLNRAKGADDLLRAVQILVRGGRQVGLLMVGGGGGGSNAADEAWRRQIESLVRDLGLGEHVRWTGYSDAATVSADLLAADLCALPFRDGATFQRGTLLAALAHGLPVLSTEVPSEVRSAPGPRPLGWDDFPALRHGENVWLVPAADPSALAQAVQTLADNPHLRFRLSQGAAALGRSLSWDAIAERHVALYAGLQ